MATKHITCIDVPLEHRHETWLERKLYFIREGDEIRIETLNIKNGRVFTTARMSIDEFNELADKLLTP